MPDGSDDAQRVAFLAALPRRIVAAGAVVRDRSGKVLLVEPTYKPLWEIPGGVVEAGESPRDAAARECLEELGIAVRVGRLLVIEHQVEPADRGDALMLLYDGGVLADTESITLPPDELSDWRFVPADEFDTPLGAEKAARVRAALAAIRDGSVAELVDGKAS